MRSNPKPGMMQPTFKEQNKALINEIEQLIMHAEDDTLYYSVLEHARKMIYHFNLQNKEVIEDESKTKIPLKLEAEGWSIKEIFQPAYENGKNDYAIYHAFLFPFGYQLLRKSLKEVLEFIDNKIKEDQQLEERERFNLDR